MMDSVDLPPRPTGESLNEWVAWRNALRSGNAAEESIIEADRVIAALEKIITDRARDWVLHPPRSARTPRQDTVATGPCIVLRGEPGLFDVEAWRRYLAEYQSDDPSEFRDSMIEHAETHLAAISGPVAPVCNDVQETVPEPRSDAE